MAMGPDSRRDLPALPRDSANKDIPSPQRNAPNTALPDLADLYDRGRARHIPVVGEVSERQAPEERSSLYRPTDEYVDAPTPVPTSERQTLSGPGVLGHRRDLFGRSPDPFRARFAQPTAAILTTVLAASPHLITAAVAWSIGVFGPLTGIDNVPMATLLVLIVQVIGAVVCRSVDLFVLSRMWIINLISLGSLMPLLALSAILGGIPYVSTERASAGPVVITGVITIIILLAIAFLTAALTWDAPEEAALVFLPAALLVPVILSGPASDVPERGITAIINVSVAAALGVMGARVLPRGAWPLVGPVALMVELAALVAARRGPEFPDTVGRVVPVTLSLILGATILLTVLVPLLAVWMRKVASTAQIVAARSIEDDERNGESMNAPAARHV